MHDGDAATRGGGDVDGVEPDAVPADDLEIRAGGHQAVGAARLRAKEDAVGARGDLDERLLGLFLAEDHVDLALELGAAILVGGTGEDDDLTGLSHAWSSPFDEWPDSTPSPVPRPVAEYQPVCDVPAAPDAPSGMAGT